MLMTRTARSGDCKYSTYPQQSNRIIIPTVEHSIVGFYEHLVEEENTRLAIPYRVSPDIFGQVQSLFEWMLEREVEKYKELILEYNRVNHTEFEC